MPVRKGGPSFLEGGETLMVPVPAGFQESAHSTLCPLGIQFHSAIIEATTPTSDPTTFPIVSLQCRHEPRLRVQFAYCFIAITNRLPMACEVLPAVPPMILSVDNHPDCGIYLSFDQPSPRALASFVRQYVRAHYPDEVATADWERRVYFSQVGTNEAD